MPFNGCIGWRGTLRSAGSRLAFLAHVRVLEPISGSLFASQIHRSKKIADFSYRHPSVRDAPAITRLVVRCGNLDVNSHYAYLLLCHHFQGTCLLAEDGAELAGFVLAYRPPKSPSTLFIWQVAVAAEYRSMGIAGRMLAELLRRASGGVVEFVEATVTPSNTASQRLFESFARRHGAAISRRNLFPVELFHGMEQHESEDLYRIGPFPSTNFSEELAR